MKRKILPVDAFKRIFELEVKRNYLHPLGIDFEIDENGTIIFYDHRDDPESLIIENPEINATRAVYARLLATSARRHKALGFTVQPVEVSGIEPSIDLIEASLSELDFDNPFEEDENEED